MLRPGLLEQCVGLDGLCKEHLIIRQKQLGSLPSKLPYIHYDSRVLGGWEHVENQNPEPLLRTKSVQ